MADYTIKFSDILKQLYINNKYTMQEQFALQFSPELFLDVNDPVKIIRAVRSKFFNFNYDLYDTDGNHKKELEKKILFYYYDYEIGEETYLKFRFNFIKTFHEILPYYNQIYKAVSKEYDFDVNVEITEKLIGSGSNTAQNTSNNTLRSTDTDDTSIDYEERLRKSDTPQNELENVEDGRYVSEYNYNNNNTSSEKTNTLNSTNATTQNSTGSTSTASDRALKGTNVKDSKSRMLKEYFEVIRNVDMEFIEELKSCFFILI